VQVTNTFVPAPLAFLRKAGVTITRMAVCAELMVTSRELRVH
jgi:hypothetical protein